jgi:histidine triad (HIT) family protein
MSCVFCTEVTRSGDVVRTDDTAWVVLHDDWSVRGHAMVVSRRHVENFSDLADDDAGRFTAVWRKAERVLLDLTGCERAIVMKLGIATPHLHVHIYPVSVTATRDDVFAAIDGRVRGQRDDAFVAAVREALEAG